RALEVSQAEWLEWTHKRMEDVASYGPEVQVPEWLPWQLNRIAYAGGTFRDCILWLHLQERWSTCPHRQDGSILSTRHDPFAFAIRRAWDAAQLPVLVLTLAVGSRSELVSVELAQWNLDRGTGALVTDAFDLA